MGLFSRPALPGSRSLRRIEQELKQIRVALERLADLKELELGGSAGSPGRTPGAQAFRGLSHTPAGAPDQSAVTYADDRLFARAAEAETTLRSLLGRDPTPEEILRAVDGD